MLLLIAMLPFVATAALIEYDATNNYVTSHENMTRSWNLTGSTATLAFDNSSALSPAVDYSGPVFYGAASTSITGAGTTDSANSNARVANNMTASNFDQIDMRFNIGNDEVGTKTITTAGLIYFKTGSTFTLNADNALSTEILHPSGFSGSGRWMVQNNSGDLYVSQETFSVGSNQASTGLTTTDWALLNTAGSDFYQTYGSFGALSLANLSAAGIYYEGSRSLTATGFTNDSGVTLRQFSAIPEPSSVLLMLGGFGALALSGAARRKRNR